MHLKTLVVGGGSIGARHLRNLQYFNVEPLGLVEPDEHRRLDLCTSKSVSDFETMKQGLDWGPKLVIIATPTFLHVEQAIAAVSRGCDIFVEKPLSHTSHGLTDLVEVVERQAIISLVGCNMRFHPGPVHVKELLEENSVGKVLFADLYAGSFLPGWHPGEDYTQGYSASSRMGGGCILDYIHELDLARWYLGDVEMVFCAAEHLSSLEIDVEDVAMMICKHSNASLSEIHLDYVQQTYERGCQIVGENGSIFWNFGSGCVRWYNAESKEWATYTQPIGWEVNQMYLDELDHLLTCVQTGTSTVHPVSDAVNVMRIALAAKVSANSGCFVETDSIL